ESFMQLGSSRSSIFLDSVNNKDNIIDEDSQSLQQNEIKKYTNIHINGDLMPIIIQNNRPKIEIFREIFDKWIEFSCSLPVPMEIEKGDDIESEQIASRVYKILVELSTIYHKSKPAIIKNVIGAARRSLILVQRLGWQVIYDSESIDPPRLRVMTKNEFVKLIKRIEEQESADNNDYYKLSDKNLKELEESF
ncbi:18777_t:CDS:2, partial [Racocetra persica]